MSAGAAQVFANVHGVLPGRKVVMVGIDPLSITVAGELKKAGAEVVGIFLPPPGVLAGHMAMPPEVIGELSRSAGLAPGLFLKLAGKIFGGSCRAIGARLSRLSTANIWGIPLHLRRAVVRVEGQDRVRSVVTAGLSHCGAIEGEERAIEADAVCLSGGLYPLADLVSAAGCPLVSLPGLGGRVPLHGPFMQTPVPGIFAAGNVTGVEGAPVAMAQGHLAGVSMAAYLGRLAKEDARRALHLAREKVDLAREESPIKFYPGVAGARKEMSLLWEQRIVQGRTGGDGTG
jgi:sarcosine oxidase subunit alpha